MSTQKLPFPKQFEPQFADTIDSTGRMDAATRAAFIGNPLAFPGKEVIDPVTGVTWKLSTDMQRWTPANGVITVDITHADLRLLRDNNNLIPGSHYAITDFQTKHRIHGTTVIHTAPVEKIVLVAVSRNKFNMDGYSAEYPTDLIRYDIDNVLCEDNLTARKGWIYYRKDTVLENEIVGFCFRSTVFRRYKAIIPDWEAAGKYDYRSLAKDPANGNIYVSTAFTQHSTPLSNTENWALMHPGTSLFYVSTSKISNENPDLTDYKDFLFFNTGNGNWTDGTSNYNNFKGRGNKLLTTEGVSSNSVFIISDAGVTIRYNNITGSFANNTIISREFEFNNLPNTNSSNYYLGKTRYNNFGSLMTSNWFANVNHSEMQATRWCNRNILLGVDAGENELITKNMFYGNLSWCIIKQGFMSNIINALTTSFGFYYCVFGKYAKTNIINHMPVTLANTLLRTGDNFQANTLSGDLYKATFKDNVKNNNFLGGITDSYIASNSTGNAASQVVNGLGTSAVPLKLNNCTFNQPASGLTMYDATSYLDSCVFNYNVKNCQISIPYSNKVISLFINGQYNMLATDQGHVTVIQFGIAY